ncbi:MAG TPA: hypothetical protein DCQ64_26610, partial [Candidatus Rokubacteria bacterium]|nr:hypothetical protein [Candidatus Rokubacteria bacterium]
EASPTPTATAKPHPAVNPGLVAWALHWRDLDVRARRSLNRWRAAFLRDPVRRVSPAPAPRSLAETWAAAGRRWKAEAVDRFAAARRLRDRAMHPGGSGASRWLPLARIAGWPRAEEGRLIVCITGESGGDPNASNGYCFGLMQLNGVHRVNNVFDPLVNLRAGLRLWRARGWSAWSVMRAYQ